MTRLHQALCWSLLALLLYAALPALPMRAPNANGEKLVFISDADSIDRGRESNSAYAIGLDGRGERRIAGSIKHGEAYLRISDVACSAAAGLLAIATDDAALNGFHLVKLDGSDLRLVQPVSPALTGIRELDLSPAGGRAVLSRAWDETAPPRYGLLIGELASEQFEVIKPPGDGRSYVSPAWSPDGQRIAYIIQKAGSHAIAVSASDGRGERIIHDSAQAIGKLAWSPDGQWLVAEAGGQIVKLRADGGDRLRLTRGLGGAWSPRFSPDGRRIAYASRSTFPGQAQLLTMSASGGDALQVTNLRGEASVECWI